LKFFKISVFKEIKNHLNY